MELLTHAILLGLAFCVIVSFMSLSWFFWLYCFIVFSVIVVRFQLVSFYILSFFWIDSLKEIVVIIILFDFISIAYFLFSSNSLNFVQFFVLFFSIIIFINSLFIAAFLSIIRWFSLLIFNHNVQILRL